MIADFEGGISVFTRLLSQKKTPCICRGFDFSMAGSIGANQLEGALATVPNVGLWKLAGFRLGRWCRLGLPPPRHS